jgi:pyruvate/2-oxoacid:ferredoxin oxidoreductase alpha subunit
MSKPAKLVISGNHAASYGAKLARAEVIPAYPITPQTEVVEKLSSMVSDGELNAKFIKVESEHSAMAAAIGASAVGARAFTATSSQGLALMHEMLHWAANSRMPVVMANVNRAMGPPWNIWADQTDSLAQRDTGWLQFYCADNQEIFDTIIQAYKVCEKVLLPGMVVLDAFILSHTQEKVEIPSQEAIDKYLPPFNPRYKLDVDEPHTFGGLTGTDWYYELRYKIQGAMEEALGVINDTGRQFKQQFGRGYGLVEEYKAEDAEILLIVSGSVSSTAKEVVDAQREKGVKLGLCRIRVFRPFPKEEVKRVAANAKKIGVIDRNISFGNEGIFFQETKSALCNEEKKPVYGFIAGLGGRDITIGDLEDIVERLKRGDKAEDKIWIGLKK